MEGVPQFSAHLPPYRFDQAGGEDHDDDDDDGEEDQDFRPKQDDDHELMFRQDGDDLGRPHDADTSSTVLPSYPNYIYQLSASAPASSVAFTGVGADSGVYVNSDEEASSRVNESGAGGGVYDVAASAPATASSRVVGGSMSVTPMFPSSLYSASLASEHGSLARRPGGLREGGLPSVSGAVAAAAAAATGAISNAGAAGRDFRPFGFDSAGNSEDRMEVSSGVGAFTASNSLRQIDTRQHLAPPQQWRRHRADSIVSEDGRLTPNPNGRPSPRFFDDAIDDGGATDASSAAGILGSAHSLEDAEAALVLASVGRMTLNRGGGKATNSAAPPAPAGTFVDFGQLESRQSPNITLPTSGTSSGLTNLMRSSAAKPPLGPSSVAPLQTLSHGTSVPAVAANPSPSLPQFSTVGGSVGAPQGYPIGSVSALSGSAPNYSPLSSRLKPLRAKTTSAEYSIMTEFVEAVARRT
ncbi:hypothetical protein DFJ73DRAFT_782608 [Zopfochytrium polystomum]|nr:hypothetical protein DFJ73DRAFT_782608 [Zopfochytrium polystomum]